MIGLAQLSAYHLTKASLHSVPGLSGSVVISFGRPKLVGGTISLFCRAGGGAGLEYGLARITQPSAAQPSIKAPREDR